MYKGKLPRVEFQLNAVRIMILTFKSHNYTFILLSNSSQQLASKYSSSHHNMNSLAVPYKSFYMKLIYFEYELFNTRLALLSYIHSLPHHLYDIEYV